MIQDNATDKKYMKMALAIGEKGRGMTNPNPVVGAVIVKNNKIIGSGYHKKYGQLHAERNALNDCTESTDGATMYVTLEPCCHTGKTPPCTDAIIKSGIRRVVIGAGDPNPQVSGQGVNILKRSGIMVQEGVLEDECVESNKVFFHYVITGLPYVTMKYAMTMDGKIAAASGESKWITGEEAREHVHIQRSCNMGIMVGKGTVQQDDPMLTSRTNRGTGNNPVRIICDTNLSIPLTAKVVQTAHNIPTIIGTSCRDKELIKLYESKGCRIIHVGKSGQHTNLIELMGKLGKTGIDSILLEGGSTLNWEMLKAGLVNRIQSYIGPSIFGGERSKSVVGGLGINQPDKGCQVKIQKVLGLGKDLFIESEVVKCLQA